MARLTNGSAPQPAPEAAGGELSASRQSLGRMAYELYRSYDRFVVHRLHHVGFEDIRPVHTNIIREVQLSGTALGEIAARANVTKQAASQVVQELVRMGYVRAMIDPADARTRVVIFSQRGMALIRCLGEIFAEADAKLAGAIGAAELEGFRAQLAKLVQVALVEQEGPGDR